MRIDIKNRDQEFFAIINDLDIRNISDIDFLKIKNALDTYGVVVLKNQNINDDEQIEFSNKFGILEKALEHDTLKGIRKEIDRKSTRLNSSH